MTVRGAGVVIELLEEMEIFSGFYEIKNQ